VSAEVEIVNLDFDFKWSSNHYKSGAGTTLRNLISHLTKDIRKARQVAGFSFRLFIAKGRTIC